jgi:hypothetical protein
LSKSHPTRASNKQKSSKSRSKKPQPASTKKPRKSSKTFPYKGVGGGPALKPAISLTLMDKDGKMLKGKPVGLVDSGCDYTTLPKAWMGQLGIDEADCLECQGSTAGGPATEWVFPEGVRASFMGRTLPLAAVFSETCPIILLGREDFFRCFKVSFDQAAEAFTLTAEEEWDEACNAARESMKRFADLIQQLLRAKAQATPTV